MKFINKKIILVSGSVVGKLSSHSGFARPVFYLTSDVKIIGGTRTIENPYIIG